MPDVVPTLSRSCDLKFVRMAAATQMVADALRLEKQGQFAAAEAVLNAAARSDGSPQSRLELADFHTRREQFEVAQKEYEALWRLGVESNDSSLIEVVLHNLAVVHRSSGDQVRAQQLQSRTRALSYPPFDLDRPHDDQPQNESADLTNRALDAMSAGDYSLAENLLLRSLCLEQQRGSESGVAADLGNLGVLAGLRGDLNVGIRFLARAYQIHRKLADDQNAGSDLLNLAEFYLKLGRLSLAARCLIRAATNFERCGARRSLAEATDRLAEIQKVQREIEHNPEWN